MNFLGSNENESFQFEKNFRVRKKICKTFVLLLLCALSFAVNFFAFRFRILFFFQVDEAEEDEEEQKLVIVRKVYPNSFDEDQVKRQKNLSQTKSFFVLLT